ncbi:hypothetical protein [Burkholderia pyrrocinia]|uniref:hypothetical protein n=1 Tax=Burkholderia pyrrocinia TaxID=60550 RepID=UPI00158B5979|nr:hypothetical protein [Burkholderia pyrrocinia]
MRRPTAVFECRFGFRADTLRLRERRAISCRRSDNGAPEKARTLRGSGNAVGTGPDPVSKMLQL